MKILKSINKHNDVSFHRRHEELGLDRAAEQPEGQHIRPPAWQEDHLSPYSIEKITTVVLSIMSMTLRISSS